MNWVEKFPLIAHRGLHSDTIAENSAESFEKSIEHGHAIEFDIQFLSNNEPIVFHDDSLARMTGEKCRISDLNPRFLKYLSYKDGQRILTFPEALELVDSRVPILIEVKNDTFTIAGLNKLLTYLRPYRGKFSIQSFNPQILSLIKSKMPHYSIGQLTTRWEKTEVSFWKKSILRHAEFLNDLNFIAVDKEKIGRKERLISTTKKIPLLCWTIKSQEELSLMSQYCEGFIFEGFLPAEISSSP